MAPADTSGRRPTSASPESVDLDQRKEHVLHTRVPKSLDRHLKSRARGLGLSVSTVVRNVLLNTFGLVEDIVTDSTNIALAIAGEEPPATSRRAPATANADAPDTVVAWQEAVLNVNAVCDQCNAVLRKGVRAAIGVREQPGPRAILCVRCLDGIGASERTPKRRKRAST